MLYTINTNEYNLNNCKYIVIKNNTEEDFILKNKAIEPKKEIFKDFQKKYYNLKQNIILI